MKRIDALTEEFKAKYERFLIGCDALEELGEWDRDEYGEMDVFFENDLMTVILRLIVADGVIHQKEAEYLNRTFGFSYTLTELKELYEACREVIGRPLDENFSEGAKLMRSLNEKLADAYRELLGLICDIAMESDSGISPAEVR